jgi:hypothetical protein
METGKKAIDDGRGNKTIQPPTEREKELFKEIIRRNETTFSASRKLGKGYANTGLIMWHIALAKLRKQE